MRRNVYSIAFVATIGFQSTTLAETFNYSRVSLSYMSQTVEVRGISTDLEATGYNLTASLDVNKNYGVKFGLGKASGNVMNLGTDVDLDVDTKMLGMFFHAPVSGNVDIVLGAAILQGELKASADSMVISTDSLDGQQLSIGVRIMTGDRFEINAGVDQAFVGGDSDSNIMIGIFGYLRKDISLGVNYSSNRNSQTTFFSVSKYF